MSYKNNELTNILKVEGVRSKGYGLVPKIVMQDRRLSRDAKAIYSYFCSYAGSGDTAFPSVKKIMYDLSFGTYDTYKKHMDMLIKYNYIEVEQTRDEKGKFTRNIYTLVDKPDYHPDDDRNGNEPDTEKLGNGQKVHEINVSSDTQNLGNGKSRVSENHSTNNNSTNKINSIYKNNNIDDVVVKKYQSKIDEVTGGHISLSQVISLLKIVGPNQVDKYIELFPTFLECQNIHNTVGFFIKACLQEYAPPKAHKKEYEFNKFEQHEYTDDDLEDLFVDIENM